MPEFSVDYTGIGSRAEADSGGDLPAGWYPVILEDASEDASGERTLLRFAIRGGPHKGGSHVPAAL